MKYLKHKNRNGFAIIDKKDNVLTFEVHRQGCEISQLSRIDESEYYNEDKTFVLSQLEVAQEELNSVSF
jgi:hypothetical protein